MPADLEGVSVGTVGVGVVGDVGSGIKNRVGRRRKKRWWGVRLNGIEVTIDAGALTGNGGNVNSGDDDNGDNNNDGGIGIEASIWSSLDGIELLIRFLSPGEAIGCMLYRLAGGSGHSRGDKGGGRGDETIGSAENIFTALMLTIYVNGLSLVLSLICLILILAPNTGRVERVSVENAGS